MSFPKKNNKKENNDKNPTANKFKKDDMLDFIEKEFQIFKPSDKILNNDNIPSMITNNKNTNPVINNVQTNKNILINPKIMSNLSNLTNSKNQSLPINIKKSTDQPIIPNSKISNIKYKH